MTVEKTPPPPPAVHVTCRLGKVSSPNGVTIDASKTAGNSTRWVFDVEHDTHRESTFELDLLSFRTGKKKDDILLSPTCAPIDIAGAKAHVRFPEPDRLRIEADDVGIARYRITVDSSQGGV